jgi:DNA repair protein RadC
LHNHPSGDPFPSEDDIKITHRIKKGAEILELELVDHIIIGDNQYYSFKEEGRML